MRLITQTSDEQDLDQVKEASSKFFRNHFEKRMERAELARKARQEQRKFNSSVDDLDKGIKKQKAVYKQVDSNSGANSRMFDPDILFDESIKKSRHDYI